MTYIGKWKLHSVMTFDDNDMPVYLTPEEYLNSPMPYVDETDEEAVADEMRERRKMIDTMIKICEDGKLYMLSPLPEGVSQEEIDAAVAEGEIEVEGNMMIAEKHPWKEEDGKILYDSGTEGEAFGEEVSPWLEIKETDNGIEMFTFQLVKA